MRYIKVLVLAVFLFLAMVFFFQNQAPLSQETQLGLNLFFLPPMHSITLPFYFIVIVSFLVGCVLAVLCLMWDRFNISARLVKKKWQVSSLEREVARLQRQLEKAQSANADLKALPSSHTETPAEEKA